MDYNDLVYRCVGLCHVNDALCAEGVLAAGGVMRKNVHMTEKAFHECFDTWCPVYQSDGREEHHHKVAGVDFFCLLKKEGEG